MDTVRRVATYCKLLFSSFFSWWWAVLTGVASILSFLSLPLQGVTFSPLALSCCLLAVLLLVFLTLTTVYRGWMLFDRQLTSTQFSGVCANDEYPEGLVFLLNAPLPLPNGMLLELRRDYNGAEVVAAVLEVVESTASGQLQAQSVWMSPGHKRDLRLKKVQTTDLTVNPMLYRRTLSRFVSTDSE